MALTVASSSINKSPNVVEVWKGQSKDLIVVVTEDAVENEVNVERAFSLDGATLFFSVRDRPSDPVPLINKSSLVADQIEIDTPATDGRATIHIVPGDTRYLEARTYVFDVWVMLSTGERYPVVEVSEFEVKAPVTVIE